MGMPVDPVLVAHLLRRATFGPFPGQVASASAAATTFDALVAEVLAATPPPLPTAPDLTLKGTAPITWWFARMGDPNAGLAEKLTWFWHGHLTSSRAKVNHWGAMWQQHLLLRAHALGNFRTLLQAITVDAAMLWYLDGGGSTAAAPNENYARELMELFGLGIGNYTEADVTAGAYALTGWRLDRQAGIARFMPANGPRRAVTFLGRQVSTAGEVVDAVCDHPACAPWIAGKLHTYLAGEPPTPERLAKLATVFRAANLEIKPLVTAILADSTFPALRRNRPRYPVEWIVGAMAALGLTNAVAATRYVTGAGQIPFRPPSVAGWPTGMGWLAPSQALARDAVAAKAPAIDAVARAKDPVAAALERCSLYEVSDRTLGALRAAAAGVTNAQRRAGTVLGLAIASPEFALA